LKTLLNTRKTACEICEHKRCVPAMAVCIDFSGLPKKTETQDRTANRLDDVLLAGSHCGERLARFSLMHLILREVCQRRAEIDLHSQMFAAVERALLSCKKGLMLPKSPYSIVHEEDKRLPDFQY